jgi:hypothetical protein
VFNGASGNFGHMKVNQCADVQGDLAILMEGATDGTYIELVSFQGNCSRINFQNISAQSTDSCKDVSAKPSNTAVPKLADSLDVRLIFPFTVHTPF